jgi:hypothetical protein
MSNRCIKSNIAFTDPTGFHLAMVELHSSKNRYWNLMNYRLLSPSTSIRLKKAVFAALTLTSLVGGQVLSQPFLQTAQAKTYHHQKNWKANLHLARLTQSNQLVMQMDIQDKPVTTYANAVYVLYAKQDSEWVQVYTSQGARLITNSMGRTVLASESVDCDQLKQKLGVSDLEAVELKAVAMFRYDEEGGDRDQRVEYEQIQTFTRITQTETTQLVALRSEDESRNYINSSNQQDHRGFHLTIAQKSRSNQKVTARVSLKSRISQGYQAEQLIGDFKYKLKDSSKAKFIKGVKSGDRVVVRLFSDDNQFIGYSEFELLSPQTAVTLVVADRASDFGVVRTIYGADSGEELRMDSRTVVYDYFTRVTRTDRYTNSQVTFLSQVQNIDLQSFNIAGYPRPQSNCTHPSSFRTGAFTLVNQAFSVFGSSLTRSLSALPGQVIRTIEVSSSTLSIYEVSQQISQSQEVTIVGDREDNDDKKRGKKKKCKSRGNGIKACSGNPGHSGNDRNDDR